MSKKVKIIQFGHETLRSVSAEVPVSYINSSEISTVIQNLSSAIPEHGVGLAAPQINEPWRIFLADIDRRGWGEEQTVHQICINPVIKSFSNHADDDWEGCLSAPGFWGKVTRASDIEVEYLDESGNKVAKTLSGVGARVFQHELDHLDGILFVDRMKDMTTLITDEEFEKIRQKER